jgi:hypothetical protein
MVGASSSDIKLKGMVTVVGENRLLGRHWRMESQSRVEVETEDKNKAPIA